MAGVGGIFELESDDSLFTQQQIGPASSMAMSGIILCSYVLTKTNTILHFMLVSVLKPYKDDFELN